MGHTFQWVFKITDLSFFQSISMCFMYFEVMLLGACRSGLLQLIQLILFLLDIMMFLDVKSILSGSNISIFVFFWLTCFKHISQNICLTVWQFCFSRSPPDPGCLFLLLSHSTLGDLSVQQMLTRRKHVVCPHGQSWLIISSTFQKKGKEKAERKHQPLKV